MSELDRAVRAMRIGKAPGPDSISNEMLRQVWRVVPFFLKDLFDACLVEGLFPRRWKEARVVVLLKGPQKDKSEPRSYRPISLLSGLGKLMERMMVARLMVHMEGKWSDLQFGFREGRCTEDAWDRVKSEVKASESRYVLGGFVDFKGAFDYLLWRIALKKLREAGCTYEELRMWHSYFRDRRVHMDNAMETVGKRAERGCPQGSISGPPIWNLAVNDLLGELSEAGVKVVAYADDLLLLVEGNTRRMLEESASEALRMVYRYGASLGVDVSDSKTVCMILKGELDMLNRVVHVRVDETDERRIKCVDRVKYLGVNVAVGMDFRVHVEGMKDRVTLVTSDLRRVLRKDWGLKRGVVNVLVKGLIMPAILYGSSVWYEQLEKRKIRGTRRMSEELVSCQRVVLYACTRVCRTVSTEAMQIIFGSLPWDIECVRRANLYKVRKRLSMTERDLVTDEEVNGASLSDLQELVDRRASALWQSRWEASSKGRVTFEWIREVGLSGRSIKYFEPSLAVCYLLTGHGSLNSFLFSRNLHNSPSCICGHEREDWIHVLCECDMYAAFRDLEAMGVRATEGGWDVGGVVGNKVQYKALCEFAERAFKMRLSVIARTGEEDRGG